MKRYLVATILYTSLITGIVQGGMQYLMLSIATEFGMSEVEMGSIVSVEFIGFTITPLLMGILADKLGKKEVFCTSVAVFALGMLLCSIALGTGLIYVGMFIIGAGFGSIDMLCPAIFVDEFGNASGKYSSLSTALMSVGAVLGPLVTFFILRFLNVNWKVFFLICFIMSLIAFVLCLFMKIQKKVRATSREKGHFKISSFIGKMTIACLIGLMLYMICENGVSYFVNSHFTVHLEADNYSAVALSLFWGAMAVSRIVVSRFYAQKLTIIKWCFFIAMCLLVAVKFISNPAIAMIVIGAIGAVYGPIWPFLMSSLIEEHPEQTGVTSSIGAITSGLGGTISPTLCGAVAGIFDVSYAFIAISISAAIAVVILTRLAHK